MSEGFVNQKELQEEVIELKRVSKKTTGGSKIRFTALVVVGNKKGRVVPESVRLQMCRPRSKRL